MRTLSDTEQLDQEISTGMSSLDSVRQVKPRLLKSTETTGVVEASIILARSHIPEVMWDKLDSLGWGIEVIFGQYVLIRNARLFGVEAQALDGAVNPLGAYSNHLKGDSTKWIGVGPIHRRGGHYYGLVFPEGVWTDAAMIQDWEFSTEVDA